MNILQMSSETKIPLKIRICAANASLFTCPHAEFVFEYPFVGIVELSQFLIQSMPPHSCICRSSRYDRTYVVALQHLLSQLHASDLLTMSDHLATMHKWLQDHDQILSQSELTCLSDNLPSFPLALISVVNMYWEREAKVLMRICP